MKTFRSIAFNLFFYGFTIGLAFSALPLLILPRRFTVGLFEFWARVVRWGLAVFADIHVVVRGAERITPDLLRAGVMVASKHQSMLDTIFVNALLKDPAVVLKRELTFVPLYGWFALKARMLVVDRDAHAKALRRLLKEARDRIASGRPLFIYPEGTRARPGHKNPYRPGVAALYGQLGITVVPMALNSGLCWGPREWGKSPGTVVMEFLEPIPPGLDRRRFMALLEDRIESATNRLLAEAGAPSASSAPSGGTAVDKSPDPA